MEAKYAAEIRKIFTLHSKTHARRSGDQRRIIQGTCKHSYLHNYETRNAKKNICRNKSDIEFLYVRSHLLKYLFEGIVEFLESLPCTSSW